MRQFVVIIALFFSFIFSSSTEAQVPDWVKKKLIELTAGKPVECAGPLGQGRGLYTKGENKTPFVWCSFINSDGYMQIALSIPVDEVDLNPIRGFKDQLGREKVWDAKVVDGLTWVGMSNDIFLVRENLKERYLHEDGWVTEPDGGKTAKIVYHHAWLKRDYLDRISWAGTGNLNFFMPKKH